MNKEEFNNSIATIINSFQASKDRIGAQTSEWELIPKRLADILRKFDIGQPTSRYELREIRSRWKSQDPLIDENGNPFVLYIHDSRWGNHVFHVAWCNTLDWMDKIGRKEKYIKKTNLNSNNFRVYYERGKKGFECLPACYNCQNKMQKKISPATLYYDRNKLDIVKFFRMYGKQDLINMDNPIFSVDYPKNWQQVSKRTKEERGNKCEWPGCGATINLEVHHINSKPRDIWPSNLKVYCHYHHTEQPLHGHMR